MSCLTLSVLRIDSLVCLKGCMCFSVSFCSIITVLVQTLPELGAKNQLLQVTNKKYEERTIIQAFSLLGGFHVPFSILQMVQYWINQHWMWSNLLPAASNKEQNWSMSLCYRPIDAITGTHPKYFLAIILYRCNPAIIVNGVRSVYEVSGI